MSIQEKKYSSKKTGKTTIKFFANVYDVSTKQRFTGPVRLTRKEAVHDESEILKKMEDGIRIEKKNKKMTFDQAVTSWFEATEGHYANSTLKTYKRYYADYIKEIFEGKAVAGITSVHIQNYINIMKKKYGSETVNKCINILSNIFNYSIDTLKIISTNPCCRVKRAKVVLPTKTTWSDEQCMYFLKLPEVRFSRFYGMFVLSLLTGARPGEVCGIAETDLTETGELTLHRGLDNDLVVSDMKTSQSHRGLTLPEPIVKAVERSLQWKNEMQAKYPEFGNNDFLFVNEEGNPIKPDAYSKAFRSILRRHNTKMEKYLDAHNKLPTGGAVLPQIALYDCRHSFATNNLSNDERHEVIAQIMGNSVKTLLSRYAHVDTKMTSKTLENYSKHVAM